jgi:hypothetical protein
LWCRLQFGKVDQLLPPALPLNTDGAVSDLPSILVNPEPTDAGHRIQPGDRVAGPNLEIFFRPTVICPAAGETASSLNQAGDACLKRYQNRYR